MKEKVKQYLVNKNYNVSDVGTSSNQSVDYPSYGHEVGKKVASNNSFKGIVICGTLISGKRNEKFGKVTCILGSFILSRNFLSCQNK